MRCTARQSFIWCVLTVCLVWLTTVAAAPAVFGCLCVMKIKGEPCYTFSSLFTISSPGEMPIHTFLPAQKKENRVNRIRFTKQTVYDVNYKLSNFSVTCFFFVGGIESNLKRTHTRSRI